MSSIDESIVENAAIRQLVSSAITTDDDAVRTVIAQAELLCEDLANEYPASARSAWIQGARCGRFLKLVGPLGFEPRTKGL